MDLNTVFIMINKKFKSQVVTKLPKFQVNHMVEKNRPKKVLNRYLFVRMWRKVIRIVKLIQVLWHHALVSLQIGLTSGITSIQTMKTA